MKMYIVAILAALLCAAFLLSPVAAGAESAVVNVIGVEPVNETTIRVLFAYQDNVLSWYEELEPDKFFDTLAQYRVFLFGTEVINVVKEQPSG